MTNTVRVDSDDDRASPAQRVGSVIAEKYALVRVIGTGGMGVVYEAQHAFTHRRVAVKIIHKELTLSPRTVTRFMREARATSSIGHPGIVEVLDGGRDADGSLYLVEELLGGSDLGKTLTARTVDHDELARLMAEALDGLAAAHACGLVHRDIKPENIFIVRDTDGASHAKILDFGVVRQMDREAEAELAQTGAQLTRTGTIVGTPYFMSPEQARGDEVDQRTDLWAIGAVMFFAVTGRHPIEADNYNALIVRIVTQPVPAVRSVRAELPEALASIIDRALMPDLDKRWNSAPDMAAALYDFLRSIAPESASPDAKTPSRTLQGAAAATLPPPVPTVSLPPPPRASNAALWAVAGACFTLGAALGTAGGWASATRAPVAAMTSSQPVVVAPEPQTPAIARDPAPAADVTPTVATPAPTVAPDAAVRSAAARVIASGVNHAARPRNAAVPIRTFEE